MGVVAAETVKSLREGIAVNRFISGVAVLGSVFGLLSASIALTLQLKNESVTPINKDSSHLAIAAVATNFVSALMSAPFFFALTRSTASNLKNALALKSVVEEIKELEGDVNEFFAKMIDHTRRVKELILRSCSMGLSFICMNLLGFWSMLQLLCIQNDPKEESSVLRIANSMKQIVQLCFILQEGFSILNAATKYFLELSANIEIKNLKEQALAYEDYLFNNQEVAAKKLAQKDPHFSTYCLLSEIETDSRFLDVLWFNNMYMQTKIKDTDESTPSYNYRIYIILKKLGLIDYV